MTEKASPEDIDKWEALLYLPPKGERMDREHDSAWSRENEMKGFLAAMGGQARKKQKEG
jgi:hypothetical protein